MTAAMTNEEIDAMLADISQSLEEAGSPISRLLWSASAVCVPLIFTPVLGRYFALFGATLGVTALIVKGDRLPRHQLALAIWCEWMRREAWHEKGRGFSATVRMRRDIAQIYGTDPRGELFPLKQAVRLVDTFNRQQQRLETVNEHLQNLRQTRDLLIEKAAQLHELGDTSRDVSAPLSRVERDLPLLEHLSRDIYASCGRLEALLVAVRRAIQVRQLHRELDELTSAVAPDQIVATAPADDLSDIESQITREIETYLRLERDSDTHLRQI